ncbi:hypothetical protein BURPS668_A0901 [Burkholderia pseudomallei 668]|nr:hypothetical protein BURPS668_A0901 [Burkholderia pseudomallei 668]
MLREPDSSSSSAGHENVAQPADAMHAPRRTRPRGRPVGRIVNVRMPCVRRRRLFVPPPGWANANDRR